MSSIDATGNAGQDPYADRSPTWHERLTGRSWDHSYHDGRPPWDAGKPHSAVVRLADEGVFAGPVLDVGCGTGENALEIAGRGLHTVGVDVAQTAIEQARAKAASRRIAATFVVADALQLERLGKMFRSALDCGLFHTFDDEERLTYVDSLASALEPGGVLNLLCFSDAIPGDGGPRHVSQAEIRTSFANGWKVVSIVADRYETKFNSDGGPAWLARIERT